MPKYRTTKKCFINGTLLDAGVMFEDRPGLKGNGFEPVDQPAQQPQPAPAPVPVLDAAPAPVDAGQNRPRK